MFVVDPVGKGFCFYLGDRWYCIWPNPPVHACKVSGDVKFNTVRDGAFRFNVEFDLDQYYITRVEAANGTVGTGATTVQLSNQTRSIDLLATPLTIASGQYHDNGNAVINVNDVVGVPSNLVTWKDRIWIDVDAVGTGSKGLHVYITFEPVQIEEV
jgi:hypothetical protein